MLRTDRRRAERRRRIQRVADIALPSLLARSLRFPSQLYFPCDRRACSRSYSLSQILQSKARSLGFEYRLRFDCESIQTSHSGFVEQQRDSINDRIMQDSASRTNYFLDQVNLIDEFDILQIVGEGWFGKILLTEHRSTQTEMVLKALPKAYTGISDFFREFHYGLHLSAHRNIITTYDVAFETAGFYVFSQEYAPLGERIFMTLVCTCALDSFMSYKSSTFLEFLLR